MPGNKKTSGETTGAAITDDDLFRAVQGGLNFKLYFSQVKTWIKAWIVKADVQLGNADNTSDVNKPVSTAQATALALKAPLASPALTGTPTAPTASAGTNTTQIATTAFTRAEIAALIASSPATLDTLNELAAALGNDPNFATTVATSLAGKQPLDADLTAIALLTTTTFGRARLTDADAAAARTALGIEAVSSYTPSFSASTGTLSAPTLNSAKYIQKGKEVTVFISVTTNSSSGSPAAGLVFTLPVTAAGNGGFGNGFGRDDTAGGILGGTVFGGNGFMEREGGANIFGVSVTKTLNFTFVYIAA